MTPREEYLSLLPLAQAKGSDKKFRLWVNDQPSIIDGGFEVWVNGQGKSEACHVSRVWAGSGKATKAEYFCVPMKPSQHRLQHQKGELYFGDKEWWERMALKTLRAWLRC